MSKLAKAVKANDNVTTTENGAKAFKSTLNDVLDFFYKAGASRGKNLVGSFLAAFKEDADRAIRVALWTRDVRAGAGERQVYRDILKYLGQNDYKLAVKLIPKTVELGRWDDLLSLTGTAAQDEAFNFIGAALEAGDGLCAKWMPRKGDVAIALRKHLGWTPKFYRKRLVELTNVVETAMCAGNWTGIEYGKLPSIASARYQKAFGRHDQVGYSNYIQSLQKGEAKINAAAIHPHEIVKSVGYGNSSVADQQWKALPDWVMDGNFIPMVDVSGSMSCPAGGNPKVTCMDVAIALGIYLSERCKGQFKDQMITFHSNPSFVTLNGTLSQRVRTARNAPWGMSTDIGKAFDLILNAAVKAKLKEEDMPKTLIILSDMQFDRAASGKTNFKDFKQKYKNAGYEMPNIVFWNLNDRNGTVPVKADASGAVLVSGFSPALMKSIVSGEDVTPLGMMDKIILDERYTV